MNVCHGETEVCNECDQRAAFVVEVGEHNDYDSATAWLCVSCLEKAVALARAHQATHADGNDGRGSQISGADRSETASATTTHRDGK